MSPEFFLAHRIHKGTDENKKMPPAIRIAMLGVTLGLAVMILSVAIVVGFKREIRDKVIGYGSHIQISAFDSNSSYETRPIAYDSTLISTLKTAPEIEKIELYATKPAILKTDSQFLGIAMKGVGASYDLDFFNHALISGEPLVINDSTLTNDILVSQTIADKLHLSQGQSLYCYFINDDVKVRKFTIKGIYTTHFGELDNLFIIGDVRHLQRISKWEADQFSGVELRLKNFDNVSAVTDTLFMRLAEKTDRYGERYYVRSVMELNPQIFSWLSLLDLNVWVILVLMAVVAGFTMIAGLLIIILERTNMIGILKALGATNYSVRKVFLYLALFLVGKGMLWGNIVGLSLCSIQWLFHLVKLDPNIYYISWVPIDFNFFYILLINLGCFAVSLLMLLAPSYLVSLIRPASSIKWE